MRTPTTLLHAITRRVAAWWTPVEPEWLDAYCTALREAGMAMWDGRFSAFELEMARELLTVPPAPPLPSRAWDCFNPRIALRTTGRLIAAVAAWVMKKTVAEKWHDQAANARHSLACDVREGLAKRDWLARNSAAADEANAAAAIETGQADARSCSPRSRHALHAAAEVLSQTSSTAPAPHSADLPEGPQ